MGHSLEKQCYKIKVPSSTYLCFIVVNIYWQNLERYLPGTYKNHLWQLIIKCIFSLFGTIVDVNSNTHVAIILTIYYFCCYYYDLKNFLLFYIIPPTNEIGNINR